MIFVTVGTHEQQFNRLIEKVDELKRDGIIKEDVFMQIGYSTYKPKYCEYSKLIPYQEMLNKVKEARIVITHGGPASFIMPLHENKIPIVVPRQKRFNEHVNNHQVEFVEFVYKNLRNIISVCNIDSLNEIIMDYPTIIGEMKNSISWNNVNFNNQLDILLKQVQEK